MCSLFPDVPVAMLRFGQKKVNDFTEGESVLFECHMKSNPAIHSIHWFHEVGICELNFTTVMQEFLMKSTIVYVILLL